MKEYIINEGVLYEESENTVVINYNNENQIVLLREIETVIWKALKEKTLNEIISDIKEEYEGESIAEDIIDFIGSLVERGILKKL